MSEQIFERHVDDHGNVSVRVSDEFVALTRDEAERLRERLDQLEAENAELRSMRDTWQENDAKLRELVLFANKTVEGLCEMVENSPGCFMCPLNQDEDRACRAAELYDRMTQLGIEVGS